jgi:hypothetical protein
MPLNATSPVLEFVRVEKAILVTAQATQASLDLAVSVDQLKAGPDAANVLAKMHDQGAGLMWMVKEMAARLKAGHSDVELKTWLTPHSQKRVMKDDKFTSSQVTMAKDWLKQIEEGKRDEMAANINRIASSENPLLIYLENIKEGLQ